jgi:hypothetical protein
MKNFLRRFVLAVSGVLSGFDRVVFKGRLPQLYSREGMNCYASANHVLFKEFRSHAKEVTRQVLAASLVESAKTAGRFEYLCSGRTCKEEVARAIEKRCPIRGGDRGGNGSAQGLVPGLAAVLQCVEPCWTFDVKSVEGRLRIVGEMGKCSSLYHYFRHPRFGWMYVRLQTWFPFEMQIGINGREWLAHRMDQEGMRYRRSDNKLLWVEDWEQAQRWLDEQLRTDWIAEFDALAKCVHPLHPGHLGRLPIAYNWTTHQSEWATDVAFHSREELERWHRRWMHHAFEHFDSAQVMRFLGRSGRLPTSLTAEQRLVDVHSDVQYVEESMRVKHWVNGNSAKLYDHGNLLRAETTINHPEEFRSYRAAVGDPDGPMDWRVMRRSVADLYRRAEVSQACNERYLECLAAMASTTTVAEATERWTERTTEPSRGAKAARKVRALNPLSSADAALLKAVSDPKWAINGIRNRDLAAELFGEAPADPAERRRRSAKVGRLIRLLRGHGILQKIHRTHRYQVTDKARNALHAILAVRSASIEKLTNLAA